MALSARFSLLKANLDPFLFAPIGEQENGMPLTVASGLARLGMDPWAEAGRLSQLPRETAAEALAAMIARVSPPRVQPSDAPAIAGRLILLLPSGEPESAAGQAAPPQNWSGKLIFLLSLLLLGLAFFNLL